MPYLTLFLIVSVPLVIEWLLSTMVPTYWHRPRWLVLPLAGGLIGWRVPMEVLPVVAWADLAFSVFLGAFLGLMVAVGGHFRDTFWRGPDERDVARTGRRSLFAAPQSRQRR